MTFASRQDALAIENEMSWEARPRPETLYQMLRETVDAFPDRPAVSYQLLSGASDPAQTMTWQQFHDQVCRAANLFRDLRINESDVVALVLPNTPGNRHRHASVRPVAGIVNPINPLLEPEQIGAILRETDARVVVTLKAFPKTDIAPEDRRGRAPRAQGPHGAGDRPQPLSDPAEKLDRAADPSQGSRASTMPTCNGFNAEMPQAPVTLEFRRWRRGPRRGLFPHRRHHGHAQGGAAPLFGHGL